MTSLSRLAVASCAALALGACSEEPENTITRGANGQPTGDTGWTMTQDGDSLRLARQVDELTLSYTLFPGRDDVQARIEASARPCLSGQGEANSEDTFTPLEGEEGSVLADIRQRIDETLSSIEDRCNVSSEDSDNIILGFDGLYFRSAPERAAVGNQ